MATKIYYYNVDNVRVSLYLFDTFDQFTYNLNTHIVLEYKVVRREEKR